MTSYINITSMPPEGFKRWVDVLSSERFVQVPATSFNPVGLAGAMTAVPHGITQALEAAGASDSIAVLNIAIPIIADKTLPMYVRTGFSTPSVTVTNTIGFSMKYKFIGEDDVTDDPEDGEALCTCNPTAVAKGYQFSVFELPPPGVDARIVLLRLTRYGTTDTEPAVANTLGVIGSFAPIIQAGG